MLGRDTMFKPSFASLNATLSIIEKNMENNIGAIMHPCLVPLVTSKGCEVSLPSLTDAFMPSWKDLMKIVDVIRNFVIFPFFVKLATLYSHMTKTNFFSTKMCRVIYVVS